MRTILLVRLVVAASVVLSALLNYCYPDEATMLDPESGQWRVVKAN